MRLGLGSVQVPSPTVSPPVDLRAMENSSFMFTLSELLQSWPPKLQIVGIVLACLPLHLWCT